ncbi:MAG TPA: hypothetical protein VL051_06790 [Burkholderiaceae bacterium]|nr:hypothetical protein [Burkholderiaceae bacterium]
MTSSVTGKGVPIGAFAALMESRAPAALMVPAALSVTPATDKGAADSAEVTCPEAATLCAALALAWLPLCAALADARPE